MRPRQLSTQRDIGQVEEAQLLPRVVVDFPILESNSRLAPKLHALTNTPGIHWILYRLSFFGQYLEENEIPKKDFFDGRTWDFSHKFMKTDDRKRALWRQN